MFPFRFCLIGLYSSRKILLIAKEGCLTAKKKRKLTQDRRKDCDGKGRRHESRK